MRETDGRDADDEPGGTVGDERGDVARAIDRNFTSPNETDRNLEAANVVDGLFAIARAVERLAAAVRGLSDDDPSS